MTIQWRYTVEPDLGILSACGHRAPEAVRRFAGGRRLGTGPVIVDVTELRDWSAEGRLASRARRRTACPGRTPLEPAEARPTAPSCPTTAHPPVSTPTWPPRSRNTGYVVRALRQDRHGVPPSGGTGSLMGSVEEARGSVEEARLGTADVRGGWDHGGMFPWSPLDLGIAFSGGTNCPSGQNSTWHASSSGVAGQSPSPVSSSVRRAAAPFWAGRAPVGPVFLNRLRAWSIQGPVGVGGDPAAARGRSSGRRNTASACERHRRAGTAVRADRDRAARHSAGGSHAPDATRATQWNDSRASLPCIMCGIAHLGNCSGNHHWGCCSGGVGTGSPVRLRRLRCRRRGWVACV